MRALAILALAAGCTAGYGQEHQSPVERGRYLVEDVVHCERCHTRRDEKGQPDRGHWLMGGPLQIKATYPAPGWAAVCPPIAGLPPGTDAEIVTLLTTGIWKNGQPPRPPMPQFHMTRADAEAVLAYLKSLKQQQ